MPDQQLVLEPPGVFAHLKGKKAVFPANGMGKGSGGGRKNSSEWAVGKFDYLGVMKIDGSKRVH
jgi:hypothetical protein